ncbi:hypothetical protein HZA42_00675 [Candidatus Peregrinibacteria bacterium]|nr:hypothetical protein [Candidatus Peregrinibacteria bacterium]
MKQSHFVITSVFVATVLIIGAIIILTRPNIPLPPSFHSTYVPSSPEEVDKDLKEYLALSPAEQAKVNSERQKRKEQQDAAERSAEIRSSQIEEGTENPHGVADSYTNDKLGIGLKFPQKFSFSTGKEPSNNTYYVAFCYDVKDDCFELKMTNSLSIEKIPNLEKSIAIDKDFKKNLCKIKKCPNGTVENGEVITYGENKYFTAQFDVPDRFGGTYRRWDFETMVGEMLYSFRFDKQLGDSDKEPTAATRKYILENFEVK